MWLKTPYSLRPNGAYWCRSDDSDIRIGIIGLGYVGLPLAVYLARHFPVLGFDIDRERVMEVSRGIDCTREVTEEEFSRAARLTYSGPMFRA